MNLDSISLSSKFFIYVHRICASKSGDAGLQVVEDLQIEREVGHRRTFASDAKIFPRGNRREIGKVLKDAERLLQYARFGAVWG